MSEHNPPGGEQLVISRRHFVIGSVLAAASAGSYAAQPQVRHTPINKQKFVDWVPAKVGPWTVVGASGVVLPPPDALSARLYDNLVTRVYAGPDLPLVMLCIAYNYRQDGVLQLHRPEICYPAGGYTLSPTQPVDLSLAPGRDIAGNAFTATGVDRVEQVLYWTRVDSDFPRRWIEQRMSVMKANLRGDIPDGALVRVSIADMDQAHSLELLRRFLAGFFAAAPEPLQHVLVGGRT
ncbi:MAG: EpsI family protein [Sphingomonadales bacterium]|nr:EpsI family protein [Sphingomonadales bacterium]